jgi:Ser/Thr protein kinase RdoA (MazF antagonist)
MLLDAMPAAVAALPGRPPWTHAVDHYAELIARSMPELRTQLDWLVSEIVHGLRPIPATTVLEPTHGDFHEGQLFVANGAISGVLDIDTVGPGRRVDDLACLLGHLSSIQRMNADQAARVSRLVGGWLPVFDQRVDPAELRLRAAAVIISLATGPYRGQEPDWQQETLTMINTAIWLLRSLRR